MEKTTVGSNNELIVKFLSSAFNTLVILLGLAIIVVWVVPLLFGLKPVTVVSGSMEPTISAGDVIWVDTKEQNARIGDIVTFHPEAYSGMLTTHRVIGKNTGIEVRYITQGDANGNPDKPIAESQIVGVVKPPLTSINIDNNTFISFPYAGYAQKHLLKIGAILVSLVVVMWIFGKFSEHSRNKKRGILENDQKDNDKKQETNIK